MYRKIQENEAVGMGYCELGVWWVGWVGGWVGGRTYVDRRTKGWYSSAWR